MFGIGTQEILFILLIVLLFFGGKKIPELMKGLGKGVKSFKAAPERNIRYPAPTVRTAYRLSWVYKAGETKRNNK